MSATPNDLASGDKYANQSQTNLIAVVEYLAAPANLLVPRSQKEILEGLAGTANRDQVFRTLQNLVTAGWAEQLSAGYVLAPDLTRMADRLRFKLITLQRAYLEIEING